MGAVGLDKAGHTLQDSCRPNTPLAHIPLYSPHTLACVAWPGMYSEWGEVSKQLPDMSSGGLSPSKNKKDRAC